jgi:ATP phosphoribosyltransferase regulatory subunit
MSSAWLLPEHIADVLPHEARRIEELRRALLDTARGYGYELVIPPLLEHIESLLSGTGQALDLDTFKLVDQLSGRTLGVRADTTPQVARIDAHLLNRDSVTRLCYCGAVLHARSPGMLASREPLQFGAEIYGHAGLEADLEALELALQCLQRAGVASVVVDLADARILRGVTAALDGTPQQLRPLYAALAAKDAAAVADLTAGVQAPLRDALRALPRLYGDEQVLAQARAQLPAQAAVHAALDDLQWLARHVAGAHPSLRISFDLAEMRGHAYYTGPRFTVYGAAADAMVRGGRYDDVGAVFGRRRAAVGFSLDVKALAEHASLDGRRTAIRAPWGEDTALRAAIHALRNRGETVVCTLPGHDHESGEFECDRELVAVNGQWVVRAL